MVAEVRDKQKSSSCREGRICTIDLCLIVFWWQSSVRRKEDITTTSVHDSKAMDVIPYEQGSIISLTEYTMILNACIRYMRLKTFSLSKPRRISNTK